ncbi:ATP-dependent DNA helicase RecG, partial [Pseudoalteromonas sp. S4389]
MSLADALMPLDRPQHDVALTALEKGIHPAQQRLVFEVFIEQNLCHLMLRQKGHAVKAVPVIRHTHLEPAVI